MRTIKFRAWDKINKKMDYEMTFAGNISELMQFIGLKDKNGKEIYEGDILKRFNKSPHCDKKWWFPIYKVGWSKIEFTLKRIGGGKDTGDWYLPLTNWNEMKVIGNIYETPELLTVRGQNNFKKKNVA